MRTRMVSLQTLRKRDCKVGSLSILGKEELKCALYVGQIWLYGPKTNIPRYRPRKWGWWMRKGVVFISSVLSRRLNKAQQHLNSCVAKIYLRMVIFTLKSRQQFHPYGFPTNLERSWIEFSKSWSERKRTGLQFEWIRKNSVRSVQQGYFVYPVMGGLTCNRCCENCWFHSGCSRALM